MYYWLGCSGCLWDTPQQLGAILAWYTDVVVTLITSKHDSQQHTSGQFPFYHEYDAIDLDKPSGGEQPCRIVLFSCAILIMKTSLETASR